MARETATPTGQPVAKIPPHWLRRGRTTYTPKRVIAFDTESDQVASNLGRMHTFKLAAATYDHRDGTGHDRTADDAVVIRSGPKALWQWIADHTDRNESTYVYAHHLDFDVMVSEGIPCLANLGWELMQMSTVRSAAYLRLKNGRHRMTLADSHSWLPTTVESIGRMLGLPKLPPPWRESKTQREKIEEMLGIERDDMVPNDPLDRWAHYCMRDAEIVRDAMLTLMDWFDSEGYGRWGLTSAQAGWSVFRQRFANVPILIHRDVEATDLERKAYFGGRREIFRHGTLPEGVYPYLDYKAHYAEMARRERVPVQLKHVSSQITLESYANRPSDWGLIAEVDIDATEPAYPVRTATGITYPIGRFSTYLAGPEIDHAIRRGELRGIRRGAYYRLDYALRPWAAWVIANSDADTSNLSEVCRTAVKGWSRSVIGKFGQVGRQTRVIGTCLKDDYRIEPFLNVDTREKGTLAWIAGKIFESKAGGEPDNAAPAVSAWINSAARVALLTLMETVGTDRVVWCDTDGIRYDATDQRDPRKIHPPTGKEPKPEILTPGYWLDGSKLDQLPGRLSVKQVSRNLTLHLPGDFRVDGKVVIKGLPAGATQVAERRFRTEMWPGIAWQIGNHSARGYETWDREHFTHADYAGGELHPDGTVTPLVAYDWQGQTRVGHPTLSAHDRARLIVSQARAP